MKKRSSMKKRCWSAGLNSFSFTLLEVIIVIVTIGILAAVIVPRIGSDTLQMESAKLLEAIRYTQHLAMVDDKFWPFNRYWTKERWCIKIEDNKYSIYSRKYSNDGTFETIYAKDPNDRKEINNVELKITVTPKTICFDELGRPYENNGEYANILKNPVTIELSQYDKIAKIRIENETGYTHYQN